MNRRFLFLLPVALVAASVASGCATQPTHSVESLDVRDAVVGKPQIRIPGASLAEVKSIAMGAAHSKGWDLVAEEKDRILLQRPMDPSSPQAVALGAASTTAPIVQVSTYFVEEGGGVLVALSAEVLTTGRDQTPQSLDYTSSYQADLLRSLESLQSAWSANRERVAAAMAAERSAAQSPEVPWRYGDPKADVYKTPTDPLKAAWAAETSLLEGAPPPIEPDAPALDELAAGRPVADPTGSVPASTPTSPADQPPAAATGNLLALSQQPQTGMWAYYAEQFALTRGCTLTAEGSVLIERQPDYEVLEVPCSNLPGFRLRCHNGVCRQLD